MSSLTAIRPVIPELPFVNGLAAASTSLGSNSTFTMNGAGDKVGLKFTYDGANTPDAVSFVVGTVTAGGTIDATLETIDATTGFASGTPVAGSATVSKNVTVTGVNETAAGMAGAAVLTPGVDYVVVLTATGGFAGNFPIINTTGTNSTNGWPILGTKDSAGAWTKFPATNSGFLFGFKNAGGSYFRVPNYAGAASSFALQAFSDSTNPDERGNRWVPEVDCTVLGVLVFVSQGSAPADINSLTASMYSSPTTAASAVASKALDGDLAGNGMRRAIIFDAPVNVTAGTEFGFAVKATSSGNISLPRYDYAANADLGGMFGTNNYAMTRNNSAGNFTGDNDSFHTIIPIISQVHDGAGGGGSSGGGPLIGGRLVL